VEWGARGTNVSASAAIFRIWLMMPPVCAQPGCSLALNAPPHTFFTAEINDFAQASAGLS